MKKVLMHVCCAPCFITIQEDIEENGMLIDNTREKVELTAYWYNPNIHPKAEHERRKDSFIKFCNMKNVKNIICDEYDMKGFIKTVVENVGEGKKWDIRCKYCYYRRLENVFKYASENGYDIVSTTLTRSPFQNHEAINFIAEELSKKYNVKYVYSDYRSTYYEGQKKAREYELYMQKFCGCVFSFEESAYYNRNSSKPQLPKGFEFLKRTPLEVKRIIDAKVITEILTEKDNGKPFEIGNLEEIDVFGIKKEDEILSLAIISHISAQEVEIKELITRKEYRNQGFGTKLLKQLVGNYKQKYKNMIIGTTGEYVPYFVEQGFNIFIKQENNILYYKKELQNNK